MEKIIHQIWVGPYEIPDREFGFTLRIREMHPDFEYHLWDDNNIPELPPVFKSLYAKQIEAKIYALAADVLRLYIVKLFGGFYLDIDEEPVAGFNGIDFDGVSGLLVRPHDFELCGCSAFFGFQKGNVLLDYMVNSITIESSWLGPSWFGAIIRQFFGLSDEAPHQLELASNLGDIGILYMPWSQGFVPGATDWWDRHFIHRALFSWGPGYKPKPKDESKSLQAQKSHGRGNT